MSEHNTIYNYKNELIANFRHGVAWSKNPRTRLGEYDNSHIYNNEGEKLAAIVGTTVISENGIELGVVEESEVEIMPGLMSTKRILIVAGQPVGKCIGKREAAAAAIVFLGKQLVQSNS